MNEIQTFDLIGFQGNGIISRTLGYLQKRVLSIRSRNIERVITHVGLAIRGNDLNCLPDEILSILKNRIDSNKIYIFESHIIPRSMDNVPDIFGSFPKGVKIRPLDEIIQNYKGKIYHSHPKFETNQEMIVEFVDFIIQHNQLPYEKSLIILLSNVFLCLQTDKRTDSVSCSELVAKVLIELKILPNIVNPEIVVPLDFYTNPNCLEKTLDIHGQIPILFHEPIQLK